MGDENFARDLDDLDSGLSGGIQCEHEEGPHLGDLR
jgi:hypothetical protein